jgi:hypothetical protein
MSDLLPKNGEIRGGERWDSVSRAWVRADEWQQRQWAREDAAFARRANQGELSAPMVIGDTMKRDLQSQVTGRIHDSKSALRREYREHGVVEIGNDVPKGRGPGYKRPEAEAKLTREALNRARQELDMPGIITKVVPDPEGMRRLRAQGKIS